MSAEFGGFLYEYVNSDMLSDVTDMLKKCLALRVILVEILM